MNPQNTFDVPTSIKGLAYEVRNQLATNGLSVSTQVDIKNQINDSVCYQIRFTKPGERVAPLVTVNPNILEAMENGELSVENAATMITNTYLNSVKEADVSYFDKLSFNPESVLPNLRMIAVNSKTNQDFLANKPHIDIAGDLSLVPIYQISNDAHVKISNNLCPALELTPQEICEKAMLESAKQPWRIVSLTNQLKNMLGNEQQELFNGAQTNTPDILVLTNPECQYGASTLFCSEEMRQAVIDRFGTSAIIIPSSTHELLAVPYEDGQSLEEYNSMVQDVNSTVLRDDDVLSDHIYMLGEDLTISNPFMTEELSDSEHETLNSGMHI